MNCLSRLTGKLRDLWQDKQWKNTLGAGGITKLLNLYYLSSAVFIYNAVLNCIDCIYDKSGIKDYILYVGLLLLFVPLTLIFKKYKKFKWNAFVFAFIGIGILLDNNPKDHAGVEFIIFSMAIYSTWLTNLILLSIISIIIVVRNVIADMGITYTLNILIVYAFSFIAYYILFHSKIKITADLGKETKTIIKYLVSGKKPKEIADILYMETDAVNKQIQRARDKLGYENNEQMIFKLSQNGQIRQ
jgi:DNA-binding CsgD family transcriptional regulator